MRDRTIRNMETDELRYGSHTSLSHNSPQPLPPPPPPPPVVPAESDTSYRDKLSATQLSDSYDAWETFMNSKGVNSFHPIENEDDRQYVLTQIDEVSDYTQYVEKIFSTNLGFQHFIKSMRVPLRTYDNAFFAMRKIALLKGINDQSITPDMFNQTYPNEIHIAYRV